MIILNVNTRISLPGRRVDPMTAARLPCLAEVEITDPAELAKANRAWVAVHLRDKLLNLCHVHNSITIDITVKRRSLFLIRSFNLRLKLKEDPGPSLFSLCAVCGI